MFGKIEKIFGDVISSFLQFPAPHWSVNVASWYYLLLWWSKGDKSRFLGIIQARECCLVFKKRKEKSSGQEYGSYSLKSIKRTWGWDLLCHTHSCMSESHYFPTWNLYSTVEILVYCDVLLLVIPTSTAVKVTSNSSDFNVSHLIWDHLPSLSSLPSSLHAFLISTPLNISNGYVMQHEKFCLLVSPSIPVEQV